jgi:glycosyltransferase involved in cell wall biosynthesis
VGGTEHATARIAKAASPEFQHLFFVPGENAELLALFSGLGEHRLYRPVAPSFRQPWRYLTESVRLAQALRKNDISLVHCADVLSGIFTASAAKLAGCKVLCHVRNRYEVLSYQERLTLDPVDHFAFVSQDTWDKFGYSVSARRGNVIYDGVEINRSITRNNKESVLKELRLPENAVLITMVARIAPQKDYITLAKAAAKVVRHFRNVRVILVGDYERVPEHRDHFNQIQDCLRSLDLQNFFIFLGHRAEVVRFIEATDIFVLSTHREGLPLVLLEAMALAKPIVATRVDGIPELLEHDNTGLLYPHADHISLAKCLLDLIHHPARASALGTRAQARVRDRFSEKHFASSVISLYARLIVA